MGRPSIRVRASLCTTSRRFIFSTIRFREIPCGGSRVPPRSHWVASPLRWMSATSFITNANVQRAMADDWHALRAEAVLQKLDSSPLGLTSREAAQRLSRFGPNELVQTARVSPLRILLSQFVDVVVIAAGDRIPADARLLEVASLRLNEASLTGESLPVSKAVEPLPRDSFLGDRKNMAFMGTAVDGGRGKAVIVETGMATQLGKIAGLVQQETRRRHPSRGSWTDSAGRSGSRCCSPRASSSSSVSSGTRATSSSSS